MEGLIEESDAPLMLVLYDVMDLAHRGFAMYFKIAERHTPLHRAMSTLSLHLKLPHAIPRCFIFCTGRSLHALIGSGSPLNVRPTHPLIPSDVLQALRACRA